MKSVAAQSYERWELIIVNDGSSDDSWAKASNLMDKYGKRRIRLINKRNGGLADARNVGMRYARGDWLCMLDSDDLLARDYLSRAAELVEEEHGNGDIATTISGGPHWNWRCGHYPRVYAQLTRSRLIGVFLKASPSSAFRTGTNFTPRF